MHCGLIGRLAGSVAGFSYSEAMKSSGLVWDVKTLDEFLTSPIAYVPGTMMGFAGLTDAAERADVIAYLQRAGSDPAICPQQ
jgi:cytochrome c